MGSGIFYPAVGGDDGVWKAGAFSSSGFGLTLGNSYGSPYNSFIRFPNVNIPQGCVIDSAYLRFNSLADRSTTTVNVNIYFNDIDTAVAPTSEGEADALVLTGAVAWDNIGSWSTGVSYNSIDLTSILQSIIDRVGWVSGQALQVVIKDNSSTASAERQAKTLNFSAATEPELHVEWTEDQQGSISEDINVLSEFDDNWPELNEDVSVLSAFDDNWPEVNEDISVNSEFIALGSDGIDEEASVSSDITGAYAGFLSEDVSVNSAFISEHTGDISEDATVNSTFGVTRSITVSDTLVAWEALRWSWIKTIADSIDITEAVEKILGIPVSEWLVIKDTEITNWTGTEVVTSNLFVWDISKAVQVFYDTLADGVGITDAVTGFLGLIITDILTCVETIINTGSFTHSISDGLTLEDIAIRLFPKDISDSFAATDTSLYTFLALLQISDSVALAETTTPGLTIAKIIADALAITDTITMQQTLQCLINEGLNLEVIISVDGELWETWVLNTSSFLPSVYSNFDFNSFAVDKVNNIAYGCKSDGIYSLGGSDDDGTAIRAGIVLPATDFGVINKKKFRKAWFGVEADNFILKMETESGDKTFQITDAEASLTKDLKGRKWTLSAEGFDSLDSINLIPIIMTKK